MNVRLTHEDMMIFRAHTSVETHARLLKADRLDADVMRLRSRAARVRGATPATIQRNVQAFETEDPRDCIPRAGAEAWRGPPSQRDDEEDDDPTPWCHACGAMERARCHCGPLARND